MRTYPTVFGNDYRLDPEEIARAITPRTKAISIVSPDNPTGGVATPEAIAAVARIAREHDLLVISDEIYDRFVYDDARHVSIASEPGMRERTLIVNGFSKCYAMTGGASATWRDRPILCARSSRSSTRSPSAPRPCSQAAALAALTGPQECIAMMRDVYAERRAFLMDALDAMGLPYVRPDGAFYVYVDITSTGKRSPEFCLSLLQDTGVMMFPARCSATTASATSACRCWRRSTRFEAVQRMSAVVARYQQEAVETQASGAQP